MVGLTLWTTASCKCRRSGGTNCATANGECSILYDKDTDTIISQLGWPPEKYERTYKLNNTIMSALTELFVKIFTAIRHATAPALKMMFAKRTLETNEILKERAMTLLSILCKT